MGTTKRALLITISYFLPHNLGLDLDEWGKTRDNELSSKLC